MFPRDCGRLGQLFQISGFKCGFPIILTAYVRANSRKYLEGPPGSR